MAENNTTEPDNTHPHERITGGESAPIMPWIAQLWLDDHFWCTANLISSRWILTARHAVADNLQTPSRIRVFPTNSYPPQSSSVSSTAIFVSPETDMALLYLEHLITVPAGYARLASAYDVHVGDQGTIYGFGFGATDQQPHSLKRAEVRVVGENPGGQDGPTIEVQGITGTSMPGDSGGPLVIGTEVVGTLSTGTSLGEINGNSFYANIGASREWIRSNSGI